MKSKLTDASLSQTQLHTWRHFPKDVPISKTTEWLVNDTITGIVIQGKFGPIHIV